MPRVLIVIITVVCALSIMTSFVLLLLWSLTDLNLTKLPDGEEHAGLTFLPKPPGSNGDNNLIMYNSSDYWSYEPFTEQLYEQSEEYLFQYNLRETYHRCSHNQEKPHGKVCFEDIQDWLPCSSRNQHSYPAAAPCIFLKMDKILKWLPDTYNDTDILPELMPEKLKLHIKDTPGHHNVWVSCEGESPADEENMGPIQYIPRQGFPRYYFPYTNVDGYISPLVAVWFEKPNKGIVISIVCKMWAKNMTYDNQEIRSSVHFELLID